MSAVKLGRKTKLSPLQHEEVRARLLAGESQADIARAVGVHQSTISLLQKKLLPGFKRPVFRHLPSKPTGNPPIFVRVEPSQLEALDAWAKRYGATYGGELSRPEAIRRLLAIVLPPSSR